MFRHLHLVIRVLLGIILSAGLGHAAESSPCSLSAAKREALQTIFTEAASTTPYGNEWWPCPTQSHCLNFPPDTTAGNLTGLNGKLILFRDIRGKYIRRFRSSEGRHYIASEGDAYSYSLTPNIVNLWGGSGPEAYTLISVQSLEGDALRYPADTSKQTREGTPVTSEASWPKLAENTKVSEIVYYDEVKVPVDQENVQVVIPASEFSRITNSFGNYDHPVGPYAVIDLLRKVLASPRAEDPLCDSGAPPK